ncbi:MAG: amidohydrolase family protein [Nitriliruptoraceae bacterium]
MQFDLILAGGTVLTGVRDAKATVTDVGVTDGRIAALGDLQHAEATERVDVTGRCVTPGFIDTHIHSEALLLGDDPDRFDTLYQGVTTHLSAPDGFGWARLERAMAAQVWRQTQAIYGTVDGISPYWPTVQAFTDAFLNRLPVNLLLQVPHHALRAEVMGFAKRHATDDEIAKMCAIANEWYAHGAIGVAVGLDYLPGAWSDERELVALAEVARHHNTPITAHLRRGTLGMRGAWEEMIRVGRQANARINFSHSTLDDELATLAAHARHDVDLGIDTYLYPAGCSLLLFVIPPRHQEPLDEYLAMMGTKAGYDAVVERFTHAFNTIWDPDAIVVAGSATGAYDGMTVSEIAAAMQRDAPRAAVDLLVKEQGDVLAIMHRDVTQEQFLINTQLTVELDSAMIASDGVYRGTRPHPRGWGTFVKVLREQVRERGTLSLEAAIFKMTGLVAERYGLNDRGTLTVGSHADVVVFDPNTVGDQSTWADPTAQPTGISRVYVNGTLAVNEGQLTGACAGTVG